MYGMYVCTYIHYTATRPAQYIDTPKARGVYICRRRLRALRDGAHTHMLTLAV